MKKVPYILQVPRGPEFNYLSLDGEPEHFAIAAQHEAVVDVNYFEVAKNRVTLRLDPRFDAEDAWLELSEVLDAAVTLGDVWENAL